MTKMPLQRTTIKWRSEPERHDYPAAQSYLLILFSLKVAAKLVAKLQAVKKIHHFKAKDLLRASELTLLDGENLHVESDIHKIEHGEELSPLLLVSQRDTPHVIIADGYHRLSAAHLINEDEEVPCKLVRFGRMP